MYTTPRKVKQESRLRRSLSLTNNNNGNSKLAHHDPGNDSVVINGEELPTPSLTSPYYTLSNRSSHHHQRLNGIEEQPVSVSGPLSTSTSSLPTTAVADPFFASSKGIPADLQNRNHPPHRFSYAGSNGTVIIPDVIDISQQPDSGSSSSVYYQPVYSGSIPPPYRNPPGTIPAGGSSSSNGHTTIVVDSGPTSPQSVPDSPVDAFHTHSAKFPIVKEVIISEREIRRNGLPPPSIASSSAANSNPTISTGQSISHRQQRETTYSGGTLPNPTSSSSTSIQLQPPPTQQPQSNTTSSSPTLTPEYIKKFQNKKLTKHLAWKDERRALTLDSETAKELQNQFTQQQRKLGVTQDTSTIRRSGSAFELERLIEAFNQEQHALVMSSLQQGLVPSKHHRLDGIDNPALDVGPYSNSSSNLNGHHHLHNGNGSVPTTSYQGNNSSSSSTPGGGKMAGYSFSDSSNSQSLSLSSSNADSIDTVIYKGPNPGAPSVRDWQRSKESMQSDFSSYRSDSQGMFDSRSYPHQQGSASSAGGAGAYQPIQFNGPGGISGQTPSSASTLVNNGYSMEYRHQQQQQQQHQPHHQQQQPQNLSVHHQSAPSHLHQQQNGGVNVMMRQQTNGTTSGVGMSGPMLPTKSPMVTHKSLLPQPVASPSASPSSNQSVPSVVGSVPSSNLKVNGVNGDVNSSNIGGLDNKAANKDSTKMFHTKTYNHIKDMISSRFGNSNATNNTQKGLNNQNQSNGMVNSNNNANNNAGNSAPNSVGYMGNGQQQTGGNAGNVSSGYIDSSMGIPPMPPYGMNQHGQIHSHSIHDAFGGGGGVGAPANGTAAPPYYTGPPTVSPANGNNNQQSLLNGNNANSYRSPPMNDRKNVNTSFRKAIHQSTLKSNLTEESLALQLRPIMESGGNLNGGNYRMQQQQYQNGEQQQQQQRYGLTHAPPSPSLVPHHQVERAQRALDKLCETGVNGSSSAGAGVSGPPFTRTGSGPMTHHHQQNGITNRMVQQFSSNEESQNGMSRPMYSLNSNNNKIGGGGGGAMSSSSASQLSGTGGEPGVIPRNRFSVTGPGPSSSTSNSSGGLGAMHNVAESSLSSPVSSSASLSYNTHGITKPPSSVSALVHQTPTTSLSSGSGSNNKTGTSSNNNDHAPPPPLPTSQKPEVSGASGHHSSNATGQQLSHHIFQQQGNSNSHNTLGLPPVLPSVLAGEKRENGDGSSGTMETPSSGNIHLVENNTAAGGGSTNNNASSSALALNKSKSEQLKKITAELHNLAISVAAEQQFHNSGHHSLQHHQMQFAPGSGSGSGGGNNNNSSSSDCENKGSTQRIGSGQSHTTSDSGVGTVMLTKSPQNSISDQESNNKILGGGGGNGGVELLLGGDDNNVMDSVSSGNDSEWVDIVEPEIRQILELEKKSKSSGKRILGDKMTLASVGAAGLATSTPAHIAQGHHLGKGNLLGNSGAGGKGGGEPSDLLADITASPIPHHRLVSGDPTQSPKASKHFDLNAYNKKASQNRSQDHLAGPSTSSGAQNGSGPSNAKVKSPRVGTKVARSNSGAGQQRWNGRGSRGDKGVKNAAAANRLIKDLGLKGIKLSRHAASQILYPHDDNDVTSTTTGLDLESMLDGQTEQTSDDDDDMSTTIDTTDAHAIRRQLESLESMYTEVLKVLGAKRFSGNRYPTSDLRNAKRRPYGSMSSLPSSVSSRPFRERKLKFDDKKKVKDIKSINKRFQRLESHVVTLARSVAHLSSEMRTQHLMVQEIESIRNEMQQLRNQVLKSSMQNQSAAAAAAQNFARMASGRNGAGVNFVSTTDWSSFRNALPSLTNPCRVRKLTKFFGDEPPLVRIFLKKLGYEKYASAFEQERIGIMELPYLTEERLNKMGIPMGPRLRILQEAQLCLKPGGGGGYHHNHESHHTHHQSNNHGPGGNLSVYVV